MQWAVQPLGEDALLLRCGHTIDANTNACVHALAQQLQQQRPAWLQDIVPAYASLALFINPTAFFSTDEPLKEAEAWLRPFIQRSANVQQEASSHCVEIPVHYGGEAGPDLDEIAQHCGLTQKEVIDKHCAVEYRVAMLGFSPGFPYLLGLNPALATPRKARPRTHVPAGSVAIGGAQTGLYPQVSPGGWNIIGRTDLQLFAPQRSSPSLLAPGDRVRFIAISHT